MKNRTIQNSEVQIHTDKATFDAFAKVLLELKRQEKLQRDGKFLYTCRSSYLGNISKFLILAEETGELSRAIMEQHCLTRTEKTLQRVDSEVRKELVQVCAVAFAWLQCFEDLDNEGAH